MNEGGIGHSEIKWGRLKFMYMYTLIGAGGFGLGMLLIPDVLKSALGFPAQDPAVFGIVGSVYTSFGFLAAFGLGSPMKFVPVLFLQLCYKLIWVIVIAAPLLYSERLAFHTTVLLIIFSTYIIGDLSAIPFSRLFSKTGNSE